MINSIKHFEEHCITNFEKLEDNFIKNPQNLAEYVYGITDELHKLGLQMLKESLETIDQMFQESFLRWKPWTIKAYKTKSLLTSQGEVMLQKALFQNKETKERVYLLDRILDLPLNQRLSENAMSQMLKEAVQTSYRWGAELVSLQAEVSR